MPHYYSPKQTSNLKLTKIKIKVLNEEFEVFSGSGVFSKKKLDRGTELLIKSMKIKDGWRVLDLGCGIGIIGLVVKKHNPSTEVVLSDVNERAVMLTKKNLRLHHVEADAKVSDGFEKIDEEFDTILFNPPQVAGRAMCFKLIEETHNHLKKDGFLQLVARHNKGGKALSEKMKETFGNVKDTAKGSGYRVYLSFK